MEWNKLISEIPEEDFEEIINNYEELSLKGVIGDCKLRELSEKWEKACQPLHDYTLITMKDIAFEIYRKYAKKYLSIPQKKYRHTPEGVYNAFTDIQDKRSNLVIFSNADNVVMVNADEYWKLCDNEK